MKMRIVAKPGEIAAKGEALVRSLSERLTSEAPDLAEALEKALPQREAELKYPMLRELKARTDAEYQSQLKGMVRDIGELLEGRLDAVEKSLGDFDVVEELATRLAEKLGRGVGVVTAEEPEEEAEPEETIVAAPSAVPVAEPPVDLTGFVLTAEEFGKAITGQERPGHKYVRRWKGPGGGWLYEYHDEKPVVHTPRVAGGPLPEVTPVSGDEYGKVVDQLAQRTSETLSALEVRVAAVAPWWRHVTGECLASAEDLMDEQGLVAFITDVDRELSDQDVVVSDYDNMVKG